jgi:phospholipid transport system substrate-binding protein
MRRLLILAFLMIFLGTAAAGPGTDTVKRANETIQKLLKAKAPVADLTKSVATFVDIDELGKAALVDQWAKLKPAEQTELLKVLRELIEANYVGTQTATVEYTVGYVGEEALPDGSQLVKTTITTTRKGRPLVIKVDYRLVKSAAGWRAVDIQTDGVSLVENYRAQFNKVIKDKGVPGLLKVMQDKLASMKKPA